ncbi:MAG: hypothetical protein KME11_09590 [Timaviella obliquedivisa GSE-PSE-MK23-08B]|nr:hypothetical protein [Timaviella obliquedivisa GSE-PSE-MK23-08B]
MTGFIRGLFGSKSKRDSEETPQSREAFYLPDDDAKTFGDIDYMRSSKKTRRTFPKKIVGEINEFINEVSSMKKSDRKEPPTVSPFNTTPLNGSQPPSKPSEPPSSSPSNSSNSSERRRSDPSMDMFRNMARDIKKKG